MKVSPTLTFLVGACAVFLLSPYLPSALLGALVGNKLMAGAFLIAALFVLRQNIVLGLAFFLAVAALFLENRRRLVTKAQIALQTGVTHGPVEEVSRPAPPIVQGEIHPEHQEPEVTDHGFEPMEGSGSNDFSKVGHSIDEKQPLRTVPPHPEEVAEHLEDAGFAHPFESTNAAA